MKKNGKKYLVIIPMYNEEDSVSNVARDLRSEIEKINQIKDYKVDIIAINDGSKDKTLEKIKENNINYIDHIVNLGLKGAVYTGIKYALDNDYNGVIQFDGDGQHQAEYLGDIFDKLEEGYDIVIGSRFKDKKKPHNKRMFGSRILSSLIYVRTFGKAKVQDPTSGMRSFNHTIMKLYVQRKSSSPEPALLSRYTNEDYKITEIQVEMQERLAGESYLNFGRSLRYMLEQTLSIILGY